jgi:hypothetical protein
MYEIKVKKWDDCWWFDDINKNIIKEELVLGAPEFIEQFIGKDEFTLIFSNTYIKNNNLKLSFNRLEEEGHIYNYNDHEIWLCSVLLKYFDNPPSDIYLSFKTL